MVGEFDGKLEGSQEKRFFSHKYTGNGYAFLWIGDEGSYQLTLDPDSQFDPEISLSGDLNFYEMEGVRKAVENTNWETVKDVLNPVDPGEADETDYIGVDGEKLHHSFRPDIEEAGWESGDYLAGASDTVNGLYRFLLDKNRD